MIKPLLLFSTFCVWSKIEIAAVAKITNCNNLQGSVSHTTSSLDWISMNLWWLIKIKAVSLRGNDDCIANPKRNTSSLNSSNNQSVIFPDSKSLSINRELKPNSSWESNCRKGIDCVTFHRNVDYYSLICFRYFLRKIWSTHGKELFIFISN